MTDMTAIDFTVEQVADDWEELTSAGREVGLRVEKCYNSTNHIRKGRALLEAAPTMSQMRRHHD